MPKDNDKAMEAAFEAMTGQPITAHRGPGIREQYEGQFGNFGQFRRKPVEAAPPPVVTTRPTRRALAIDYTLRHMERLVTEKTNPVLADVLAVSPAEQDPYRPYGTDGPVLVLRRGYISLLSATQRRNHELVERAAQQKQAFKEKILLAVRPDYKDERVRKPYRVEEIFRAHAAEIAAFDQAQDDELSRQINEALRLEWSGWVANEHHPEFHDAETGIRMTGQKTKCGVELWLEADKECVESVAHRLGEWREQNSTTNVEGVVCIRDKKFSASERDILERHGVHCVTLGPDFEQYVAAATHADQEVETDTL